MAELLGIEKRLREQAQERIQRTPTAEERASEATKREERKRENQAIQELNKRFPLEEGELSEVEAYAKGRPISDEVPGGYLSTPRLREGRPPRLPSERMLQEYEDLERSDTSRPLPPVPRSVGGFLGQGLLTSLQRPLRHVDNLAKAGRDRGPEAEIFETIYGSEAEPMGIPEPGQARRGLLGKDPHPEFYSAFNNAYNDYTNQAREGTLWGPGEDPTKLGKELQEQEQKLEDAFDRRARGFMRMFALGGNPAARIIPAEQRLQAYNEGRPEEFTLFVRMLAEIRAKRQALMDNAQIRSGAVILDEESRPDLSRAVRRAAQAAQNRAEAREK